VASILGEAAISTAKAAKKAEETDYFRLFKEGLFTAGVKTVGESLFTPIVESGVKAVKDVVATPFQNKAATFMGTGSRRAAILKEKKITDATTAAQSAIDEANKNNQSLSNYLLTDKATIDKYTPLILEGIMESNPNFAGKLSEMSDDQKAAILRKIMSDKKRIAGEDLSMVDRIAIEMKELVAVDTKRPKGDHYTKGMGLSNNVFSSTFSGARKLITGFDQEAAINAVLEDPKVLQDNKQMKRLAEWKKGLDKADKEVKDLLMPGLAIEIKQAFKDKSVMDYAKAVNSDIVEKTTMTINSEGFAVKTVETTVKNFENKIIKSEDVVLQNLDDVAIDLQDGTNNAFAIMSKVINLNGIKNVMDNVNAGFNSSDKDIAKLFTSSSGNMINPNSPDLTYGQYMYFIDSAYERLEVGEFTNITDAEQKIMFDKFYAQIVAKNINVAKAEAPLKELKGFDNNQPWLWEDKQNLIFNPELYDDGGKVTLDNVPSEFKSIRGLTEHIERIIGDVAEQKEILADIDELYLGIYNTLNRFNNVGRTPNITDVTIIPAAPYKSDLLPRTGTKKEKSPKEEDSLLGRFM
jgi:hypothetical protein